MREAIRRHEHAIGRNQTQSDAIILTVSLSEGVIRRIQTQSDSPSA